MADMEKLENQIAHMIGHSLATDDDYHIPKNLPGDIIKLVRKAIENETGFRKPDG